jgi:hypothetical protein
LNSRKQRFGVSSCSTKARLCEGLGHEVVEADFPFDGDRLIKIALDYVNYTPVYNISGQPAMSVPLGWAPSGLPIGSQFAARIGNEKTLFELTYRLEEAANSRKLDANRAN